ncbi:phosphate transporter (Pho88) [Malassezia vespertilionis]|uniref:phosphate transporter (Pho88) n=1 Tax=Malassezia vespertilionis TaxID=2020962 RepID=UPI0024B10BF8|nr:phosphate transporter (Pho88) [Malassezia vespertilionis]WFD06498.1 phosphate transporter (Pho88) [Malassezia vespertilionis]
MAYVSSVLLCLAVYYYCSYQIKKKNDLTVLKFVKAKSPMSQEPGELITTTHKDYDMAEVSKSMRGILMGCGLLAFMHLYMGYTNPYVFFFTTDRSLVIQSILPVKNALESNMAKIWVWGVPATGELKRPFKPAPGLFGGAGGPQTDKASVQEAEKVTAVVQPKTE